MALYVVEKNPFNYDKFSPFIYLFIFIMKGVFFGLKKIFGLDVKVKTVFLGMLIFLFGEQKKKLKLKNR
jgi:hypothetical protein